MYAAQQVSGGVKWKDKEWQVNPSRYKCLNTGNTGSSRKCSNDILQTVLPRKAKASVGGSCDTELWTLQKHRSFLAFSLESSSSNEQQSSKAGSDMTFWKLDTNNLCDAANYYSTDLGCCKGALLNCWKNQYRPEPGFSSRVNYCCSLLANSNSKLTLATLLHIVSLKIRCCRDCCDRFWICIVLLYRHVLEQNS